MEKRDRGGNEAHNPCAIATHNRSWSTARTVLFPCRAGMKGPGFGFTMKWFPGLALLMTLCPRLRKWITSWRTEVPHYKV